MKEIRNANGKLVASVNEATRTITIVQRGCITELRYKPNGTIEVVNRKKEDAA